MFGAVVFLHLTGLGFSIAQNEDLSIPLEHLEVSRETAFEGRLELEARCEDYLVSRTHERGVPPIHLYDRLDEPVVEARLEV